MAGLVPAIHVLFQQRAKEHVDARVTRLRFSFAGSSVLVRRSLGEGGSPAMTNER
jgi:hypothetical protein